MVNMQWWLVLILVIIVGFFAYFIGLLRGKDDKEEYLTPEEECYNNLSKEIEDLEKAVNEPEGECIKSDDFEYTRTPYDMLNEGWCDCCDDNYADCEKLGYCKGEREMLERDKIAKLNKEARNGKKSI